MADDKIHLNDCGCGSCGPVNTNGLSRKNFLRTLGAATVGLGLSPVTAYALTEKGKTQEMLKGNAVRTGKVKHLSLLHTSDIHGQIHVHDEFFWENDKAVFKKRGGFAHLKTMINELRKQNPDTLLLDGGDCFQGSGLASLSEGRGMVPLMNNLGYDLVLPGNWEVIYGKKTMLSDLGAYNARKICANMFNDDAAADLMFPPYSIFYMAGIKIGFIGYNDPLTPLRQAPAYNKGIRFSHPEKDLAKYVRILKEQEQCKMVFVMSHMGLVQQLDLASQPYAEGVDYILGADTHERIREPLAGKYAKVTEPGAFASFVGKLDLLIEDGVIKEESYELLEVDPGKYTADREMTALITEVCQPYEKELKRVIGKTKTTLMRYFVIETPMDNMITDALMWKFSPDITIANGFRFCPPLVAGSDHPAEITSDYLYSMIPGNNDTLMADVSGKQLVEWLEKELENVFSKDPAKRLGGWLVRFQGMKIKFTIDAEPGKRLVEILVKGEKLDEKKIYRVVSCEREGDPESLLCRIKDVKNTKRLGVLIHNVVEEYLAEHSPVAPAVDGRATATDAPATLLTQVKGMNYQFR
jgi:2',3'-cyclic-nucleotide 2'-phosphodiesterase (5'-nucleotidase family)